MFAMAPCRLVQFNIVIKPASPTTDRGHTEPMVQSTNNSVSSCSEQPDVHGRDCADVVLMAQEPAVLPLTFGW